MTGEEMEELFAVETGLGPIWLWGRDTGQPVLLIITGAFCDARLHVADR